MDEIVTKSSAKPATKPRSAKRSISVEAPVRNVESDADDDDDDDDDDQEDEEFVTNNNATGIKSYTNHHKCLCRGENHIAPDWRRCKHSIQLLFDTKLNYTQGIVRFEVKWEGYDKKADRTWEPEENLRCVNWCPQNRSQLTNYSKEIALLRSLTPIMAR